MKPAAFNKGIKLTGCLAGIGTFSAISLTHISLASEAPQKKKPLNVLFIAVDDFRPQLGCYGTPVVKSPNIDKLAKNGLLFNHAYCQQAVSSPSRTSLMTGLRPDGTKVWDLQTHFRNTIPDVVTLPEQFKKYGYHTLAFSKLYHGSKFDDPNSWSEKSWFPNKPPFLTPEGQAKVKENNRSEFNGIPYEAPDVPDNALKDGQTADEVIKALPRLKDKPFFLAVGFLKPHLPFVAPKKYWDLYTRDQFKLPEHQTLPDGAPPFVIGRSELLSYLVESKGWPIEEKEAISLLHGYHACVSYTDAQIGRIIDELKRLDMLKNTVVILWGDHGWHLGEHGHWTKHTNFEIATRAPLIISVPGQKNKGKSTGALVEFVDIYPSLCDICGVPMPDGLEGTSFKPLIDKPGMPWKKAAFSQYPKNVPGIGQVMGYTMRTSRYRLTRWAVPEKNFCEYELYDYSSDPLETKNWAKDPAYSKMLQELIEQMDRGWKGAI